VADPASPGGLATALPAPPSPGGARRGLWQWLVAVAVSGGILVYLFVGQGVDARRLGPLLAGMSPAWLAGFVGVSVAALLLRATRYWLLLERRAPFGPVVLVTLVRNLFVDLVPARAGAAVSYLYLVTARLGLPIEAGVASLALSFVLDTLTLAPLLLGAVLLVGSGPMPPAVLALGCLVLLAGSAVGLWLLAPGLRGAAALARRLPGRLARIEGPLAGAAVDVRRLEGRQVLLPAVAVSLVLRLAKYGAYYCLLHALLASQAPPPGEAAWNLGFLRVFLSVAGAELASSLPVPTVAGLGIYEAAGALGFGYWLGLPREMATLAVTAFHGLSQVHDYGLGLIALLVITAPLRPRRAPRDRSPGA
jgi:hypothetical protein